MATGSSMFASARTRPLTHPSSWACATLSWSSVAPGARGSMWSATISSMSASETVLATSISVAL